MIIFPYVFGGDKMFGLAWQDPWQMLHFNYYTDTNETWLIEHLKSKNILGFFRDIHVKAGSTYSSGVEDDNDQGQKNEETDLYYNSSHFSGLGLH